MVTRGSPSGLIAGAGCPLVLARVGKSICSALGGEFGGRTPAGFDHAMPNSGNRFHVGRPGQFETIENTAALVERRTGEQTVRRLRAGTQVLLEVLRDTGTAFFCTSEEAAQVKAGIAVEFAIFIQVAQGIPTLVPFHCVDKPLRAQRCTAGLHTCLIFSAIARTDVVEVTAIESTHMKQLAYSNRHSSRTHEANPSSVTSSPHWVVRHSS